jgi:hypothetical protein
LNRCVRGCGGSAQVEGAHGGAARKLYAQGWLGGPQIRLTMPPQTARRWPHLARRAPLNV